MRIIILTSNKKGGMVHYTSQMAETLARNGHQVLVIGPEGIDRTFFHSATVETLPLVTELKDFMSIPTGLIGAAKLVLRIIDERADIIHLNELHPVFAPGVLITSRKQRFSVTLHDIRPHPGIRTLERNLFLRFFLTRSQLIFIHGKKGVEDLHEYEDKVREVRHGDYNFLNDDSMVGEEEPGTVLFFGRIEPYKGLERLIDVVPDIAERVKDFKLIIAGSGQIPALDILDVFKDHIEIHNYFIPESEIPFIFNRSAIVVLPYIECTQSGVVPIAYAFSKPVIATDVGCLSEVVNESNGILIPSGDRRALIEAIVTLLNDRNLRKKLGERGHDQFQEQFSWKETIKKYEQGFIDLIGSEEVR